VCDDGDACTDDVCTPGVGCENPPKLGLDSVTCTCDRALPDTCAGVALPTKVQRLSARACRFFSDAVDAKPGPRRRKLRQGARALRRAIAAVVRAQLKGLPPECASDLTQGYRDASERASLLADTR
jgi:hypothetical protein